MYICTKKLLQQILDILEKNIGRHAIELILHLQETKYNSRNNLEYGKEELGAGTSVPEKSSAGEEELGAVLRMVLGSGRGRWVAAALPRL